MNSRSKKGTLAVRWEGDKSYITRNYDSGVECFVEEVEYQSLPESYGNEPECGPHPQAPDKEYILNVLFPKLSDRSKSILTDYLVNGLTQTQIAKKVGLTRGRISQILKKELATIREGYKQFDPIYVSD